MSLSTEARGSSDIEGDYPDLNDAVSEIADRPEELDAPPQGDNLSGVRERASNYIKEFRLQLLHRMLMRRIPLEEIAAEMKLSVHTIMRDRTELYKRLRGEAQNLDINHLIGDTMGFYNEIQGMSLRTATAKKTPTNIKLAALRTALSAKNDMHRFLNAAGVYDVLRYRVADDNAGDDISKLMEMTEALLKSDGEFEESLKEGNALDMIPGLALNDEGEEEIRLL